MKLKLISEISKNNELGKNTQTIINHLNNSNGSALLLFSEAFLNGFNSFIWKYEIDIVHSIRQDSKEIKLIKKACMNNNVAVGFGYLERTEEDIYCSYMIIDSRGRVINNYRRISTGWKEVKLTTEKYKEGHTLMPFEINGHKGITLLCGDLWDDNIRNDLIQLISQMKLDFVIWPNHLDYSIQQFNNEMNSEYAVRTKGIGIPVFLINDISETSFGGAVVFKNGKIISRTKGEGVETLIFDI